MASTQVPNEPRADQADGGRGLDRLYAEIDPRLKRNKAGPLSPLLTPARVARNLCVAARDAYLYAPAVAATHGYGTARQLRQLIELNRRYGFTAEEFFRFRLYGVPAEQAALFVAPRKNGDMQTQLYRQLSLRPGSLADKRKFYRTCLDSGLPVATTLADFSDGAVHWWTQDPLPSEDLFVKEAASMCGAGAALWTYEGSGTWANDDKTLDADALGKHLADVSRAAPLLLQPRLRNHPALADLAPVALCTVRVVTLRAPDSESIDILLTAFRMAIGNDVADNFARGGLACAVDVATGVLGTAVFKALDLAHLDVDRHPDTGAPIKGRSLPWWQETLELTRRAHGAFPNFPSIGWDVALTPDGPVLLEANYNWDVVLGQQAGWRPLGATCWPEHFLSWLRSADSRRARAETSSA